MLGLQPNTQRAGITYFPWRSHCNGLIRPPIVVRRLNEVKEDNMTDEKPIDESTLTPAQKKFKEKVDEMGRLAVEMLKFGAEFESLLQLVLSHAAASRLMDRSASWLLVGVGATIALMVSSLGTIVTHVGTGGFKALMIILLAAAVVGLIEKVSAIYVQSTLEIADQYYTKVMKIAETFMERKSQISDKMDWRQATELPDVSMEFVNKKYKSLLPSIKPVWLRRLVHSELENDYDYHEYYRKILKAYTVQRIAFGLEYLLAYIFVVALVWLV